MKSGIVGLAALINQADEEKPDFNAAGVRFPNFLAMLFFAFGIMAFLWGTWDSPNSKLTTISKPSFERVPETQVSKNLSEKISTLNLEQQVLLKNFIDKAFP